MEKEQLAEDLKSAFDRISELETFIDKLKFSEKGVKERSSSGSLANQSATSLSKSTSNLRAFPDETRLDLSGFSNQGDMSFSANDHYQNLLDDLQEKDHVIEKLESEIDNLRTELDAKDHLRPPEPQKKSIHSLLEDLSERENQIFEKEEELLQLQDELSHTKRQNEKLKSDVENLSRTRNSMSRLDDPENSENAELAEVKQKNEMQQEIILKLTEQIQLLRNSANQVRFKISRERCFSGMRFEYRK